MVRGEADRARVVAEVVQAQDRCVPDERTQDSSSARQVADRCVRLWVDTSRDEAFELGARRIDDSERGVAGFRQLRRDLDYALEPCVKRYPEEAAAVRKFALIPRSLCGDKPLSARLRPGSKEATFI
jgi:hypothetical protein